MKCKLYTAIASAIQAQANCAESGNHAWLDKWTTRLDSIEKNLLPSGSGFNAGTKIDYSRCTDTKLVFSTSFHHMDNNGYYCGWSDHEVILSASLQFGFTLRVTGRNTRNIREYIQSEFEHVLNLDYEATATGYAVSYPGMQGTRKVTV